MRFLFVALFVAMVFAPDIRLSIFSAGDIIDDITDTVGDLVDGVGGILEETLQTTCGAVDNVGNIIDDLTGTDSTHIIQCPRLGGVILDNPVPEEN